MCDANDRRPPVAGDTIEDVDEESMSTRTLPELAITAGKLKCAAQGHGFMELRQWLRPHS